MPRNDFHKPLLDYLTGTRGYPADLAEHMANHGFRMLTDQTSVRHVLEGDFGLVNIAQLPEQGLVIPYHDLAGVPLTDRKVGGVYIRVRCEPPAMIRSKGKIKPAKFLAPKNGANHLSLPRGQDSESVIAMALRDGRLIFTEGELKAWVSTWFGFPTISISGVWNWKGKPGGTVRVDKPDGSYEREAPPGAPIPDLDMIPWDELRAAGVRVLVVFDSDSKVNTKVATARDDFALHLREDRGMEVLLADLPSEPNGSKNGMDDYLLRHGAKALEAVLAEAAPEGATLDVGAHLAATPDCLDPEELSARLAPVWDALATLGDRTLRDRWKNEIAARFGLGRDAIRGNIKAAEQRIAQAKADVRRAQFKHMRGQQAAQMREGYGLDLSDTRYTLGPDGVGFYKSENLDAEPEVIAPRPIWPAGEGTDLATGAPLVKLAWVTGGGTVAHRWCSANITTDPHALRALPGVPLSMGRMARASDWLSDAQSHMLPERRSLLVTSRLGWLDLPEGRRFVLPGDPEVEFTGEAAMAKGSLKAWAAGLELLMGMGESGYTGIACVALSAAAPLARFIKKRNPIIGLAAGTGSGKGSVMEFALSAWGAWEDFTVHAIESTTKGVQNKGRALIDLPYFIDELHQIHKQEARKAENALYYLANGFERTVATKDGGTVGGARRVGVGFYASEYPLGETLQGGAQCRVVEMEGAPLQTGEQSDLLKGCARDNPGAIAPRLAELVQRDQDVWGQVIEDAAREYGREFPDLQGDDRYTVAMVEAGLALLAEATGLDLPLDVGRWMADLAAGGRASKGDEHKRAFLQLLDLVLAAEWKHLDGTGGWAIVDFAQIGGVDLAWRQKPGAGHLDINPAHPHVMALLKQYGGPEKHLRAWADRGWLKRHRDGFKTPKRARGGGWAGVWRIPAEVLEGDLLGVVGGDLAEATNVGTLVFIEP